VVDAVLADTRADIGPIDDPAQVERDDDKDYLDNLADTEAPLFELVSLPVTPDHKVHCPFHDDAEPSCVLYADHFHCFGRGEHGGRLDWLVRAEGMTEVEAAIVIKDWPEPPLYLPRATLRKPRKKSSPSSSRFGSQAPMAAAGFRSMHACGFQLVNRGLDTRTLQALLGHKNIQHTVRYTELSPHRFKNLWPD
jgi:hypothetical protein